MRIKLGAHNYTHNHGNTKTDSQVSAAKKPTRGTCWPVPDITRWMFAPFTESLCQSIYNPTTNTQHTHTLFMPVCLAKSVCLCAGECVTAEMDPSAGSSQGLFQRDNSV